MLISVKVDDAEPANYECLWHRDPPKIGERMTIVREGDDVRHLNSRIRVTVVKTESGPAGILYYGKR